MAHLAWLSTGSNSSYHRAHSPVSSLSASFSCPPGNIISSLQPSSKPFSFHYVIPISWMKDQGIYQSCSWGFASSSTQSLTSTVRLMLMKKEGSQILGWTRAWLDPAISGLRLPQRPYRHQLALLPSLTFPPLKSSLIQKGKQHWWKRIWASWQRPGSALGSTSPLLSLSSPFHSRTWRAMMPYGAVGDYTHRIYTKGLAQPLTLNVKSLVCPLKAALIKNLQY